MPLANRLRLHPGFGFNRLRRAALLLATGQRFLLVERPRQLPRRVLWYYDWETIGDAVMDLSQRVLVDASIELDLCMPKGPIELFEHDGRFRRVHRRPSDCEGPYDLIVTQWITTELIRRKARHFPLVPWLSVMCHERGELFCRTTLSFERLRPLFGSDCSSTAAPPSLDLASCAARGFEPVDIVVAVGGRDPRRTYSRWPEVVEALVRHWPSRRGRPKIALVGAGVAAKIAADEIVRLGLPARFDVHLDLPGPLRAAQLIAAGQVFVGCDGGLMHVAAALGKPGAALFCEILPQWRLHATSGIVGLFEAHGIDRIEPEAVACATLRAAGLDDPLARP
ncbi:MAG: glycosyltransferase family 9 protein [Burkholderiaceae bacterium]